MLRLNLKRSAEWVDLGFGVRLLLEPLTPALMNAARRTPAVKALVDAEAPVDEIGMVVAKELAVLATSDWDGVGDEDGALMPLSRDGLLALLDLFPLYSAFEAKYVAGAILLDTEKNGSAPSPNGTSEGATNTAAGAEAPAKSALTH